MKLKTHFYLEIGFLAAGSLILMAIKGFNPLMIRVFLISIISLNLTLFEPKLPGSLFVTIFLSILACFDSTFIYCLPIITRVLLLKRKPIILIPLVIPLLISLNWLKILVALGCLLAIYFSQQDRDLFKIQQKVYTLQDDSFEQLAKLQEQNLLLKLNGQTKLKLQVAQERNRIARDIHDNVGHLLSSSIIQLGAIQIVNHDSKIERPLTELNTTINQAMNSIRNSVQGIQEKSLTLTQALKPILANFTFCTLEVEGEIFQNLPDEKSQVIVMTIKEALTNVIKHSDASKVIVIFRELPAFYQVQIKDNGTQENGFSQGMGLTSMKQRAEEISGQLHLHQSSEGFIITLILPRKDQNAENSFS
ncbi:sensor histidine kinase [Xylocopilactobacillus apis]|uniref:sensor histidine kinase n=1 Tax=Xylocopilactobacillus apis TaxID=2932183 RepID=UPI00295584E3|nr:histidine kinase [Xylocopilactobacillus apis]